MNRFVRFSLPFACFFLSVSMSQAAGRYDVSVGPEDISVTPTVALINQPTRVYITIQNDGSQDIEGSILFYIDDTLIGSKPFSVRANALPEQVWLNWQPTVLGTHTIRVEAQNENSYPDATPGNNSSSKSILVDKDTDGDSVPDSMDQDADNDGLLNDQEVTQHTNPLKKDTDGDGVSDKQDVYPLDASRSVKEVPRPVIVPPAVVKHPTTPSPIPASSRPVTDITPPTGLNLEVMHPSSSVEVVTVSSSEEVVMAATDTAVAPAPVFVSSSEPASSADGSVSTLAVIALVTAGLAGGFGWLSYRRD